MNIATLLQAQAAERPDGVAIIDGRRGAARRYTFAELETDCSRMAALLHRQGIGTGDRLLLFQPISYELYVVLLAIFRLGAVAIFLDPSAGRRHIEQCCRIGAPRALIASPRAHLLRLFSPALQRIAIKFVVGRYAPGAIPLGRAATLPRREAISSCDGEEPALLTFTSGSTGEPKAAERSHQFLLAQHRALAHALELQAGEVDLTTLPIFLLANLASGLTSVIPRADLRTPGRIDAAPVVEQIARFGVTRSAGSPALFQRLVSWCETQRRELRALRRIDMGGGPVFPQLLSQVQQVAPEAKVAAVYGSFEAEPMAHLAWQEISEHDMAAMAAGAGLLAGKPVAEVSLRILPDRFATPLGPFTQSEFQAEALGAGVPGEIVVTGEHVMKGYLAREGESETKFDVDGVRWHRTGDAGLFDDDGRLWLLGRCRARIEDEKGVLYPFAVECAAQFIAGVQRSAFLAHQGRRTLLVEGDSRLSKEALLAGLAWAGLDEVRQVRRLPVDRRHNAKIDYTRLHKLLR
jgi:acyl-CoA synthetase (AMP-forming)/AMP-acid ligase II